MPPVPAIRGDRLVKALERAGFKVARGTLRGILNDIGLTVDELQQLL